MRTILAYIILMFAELPALIWVLLVMLAQWLDPASVNEDTDFWIDDDGDGPYGF